jgi:hypothetical protein
VGGSSSAATNSDPRIANQLTCSQFVTGRHAAVFGIAEADWGANPAAASQSDPADKF